MKKQLSKCCGAEAVVQGSKEGTSYFVCTECMNACDLTSEPSAEKEIGSGPDIDVLTKPQIKVGQVWNHKLLGKCLVIAIGPEIAVGGLKVEECRVRLMDGSTLGGVKFYELDPDFIQP